MNATVINISAEVVPQFENINIMFNSIIVLIIIGFIAFIIYAIYNCFN